MAEADRKVVARVVKALCSPPVNQSRPDATPEDGTKALLRRVRPCAKRQEGRLHHSHERREK